MQVRTQYVDAVDIYHTDTFTMVLVYNCTDLRLLLKCAHD
jgi:hypothetical protein